MNIYKKTNVFCPHCNSELELNEDTYNSDVDYYWECSNRCDVTDLDDNPKYDKEVDRIITERLSVFMV